ncbi:hypothetical protein [Stygiobacter electus]|uniref:Uncharacterized protein n=1 Tax=Stygiobacter electus TaxID=3032292 RepID=A0AAE3NXT8_9BACT|nr:hypothetical protein [Stygiobacter electus]MDF1610580.1 hypothetical protein [Stygiobacter electus]
MINSIKNVLTNGSRSVFYNAKIVFLMWFLNAASAIVLTVPIYNLLLINLSHSNMSDRLTEHFDYFWFLQFRHLYEIQLDQIPISIYAVVVIYTIIQTFFLAGIIAIFNNPAKNHLVDFFYGGVKYFFRFFKVLFYSLILFIIIFFIYEQLGDIITYIFRDSENELLEFLLKSLRYVFLIFMIGCVTMISDYTKVSLAVNDNLNVHKEIIPVLKFLKNNFTQAFTVFLTVAVLGAVGVLVYNIIGKFIPRIPAYFLAITFVLQQLLIIFRLLIRMLFCSTEVLIYKDISAEEISAEVINN